MPNKLTNLRIDEVSSVDRGAGLGVRVLLMKRDDEPYWKREFSADERRSAAGSGAALPDGSFPIKDKKDLSNAIQAIGRAKDRGRAMAHIKTRARALGATDMLPDKWSKRETDAYKALALAVESIGSDPPKLVECFKQFHSYLNGDEPKEQTMEITKEALDEMIKGAVAATLKEAGLDIDKKKKPAKPENENTVGDAEDGPDATGGGDSAAGDTGKNMGHNWSDDEAKKFLENLGIKIGKKDDKPVNAEVAKAQAEVIDLRKRVEELTEKSAVADFAKRAENLGLPSADGENLRKAYKGDVKALDWMIEKIGVLTKQVEKAGLFGEIGSGGGAGPMDAAGELKLKAADLRKSDPKLTEAQAYVRAMELNPDIAKREREEAHARIQKLAQ